MPPEPVVSSVVHLLVNVLKLCLWTFFTYCMTHVASEMFALMYMCLEEHEESSYVEYWNQNL